MPTGIYNRTKEYKIKVGEFQRTRKHKSQEGFQKGHKINIGKKFTLGKHWKVKDSSKMNKFVKGMISSRKGIKLSKETKRKMNESALGRKASKETRLKMSKRMKGRKAWNKGKIIGPMPISVRKKIGVSNIGKHSGEKCHFWKGGKSKLSDLIRMSYKYRQWRSDIFTRDDFTCQQCNQRGFEIHPHHIKTFSAILIENNIQTLDEAIKCEELWNINNGITLCLDCHKKTNSYGRG